MTFVVPDLEVDRDARLGEFLTVLENYGGNLTSFAALGQEHPLLHLLFEDREHAEAFLNEWIVNIRDGSTDDAEGYLSCGYERPY